MTANGRAEEWPELQGDEAPDGCPTHGLASHVLVWVRLRGLHRRPYEGSRLTAGLCCRAWHEGDAFRKHVESVRLYDEGQHG